ncbi:MAG: hypothetical protein JNK49_13200 [Planctomycetes bacterium]|nr:hypothetical protein [Planctomycetota bacterium]
MSSLLDRCVMFGTAIALCIGPGLSAQQKPAARAQGKAAAQRGTDPDDAPALRSAIDLALDRARPALLRHLQQATTDSITGPGLLALLLLAAIHDGVAADDPGLQAGLAALAKGKPNDTYSLALRLLVLDAWPDFPKRTELAKVDTAQLLRHQDSSGSFGYGHGGGWDLSNTQYAALGLRAARSLGATVPKAVFERLGRHVIAQQGNYGGFGYASAGAKDSGYASMTAAGIAVLAICRQALDQETPESVWSKHIARGWQWFVRTPECIGSLEQTWTYYFHYGLERAAILCDVEKVGGKDWYAHGAAMLVDAQGPGGGWQDGRVAGFGGPRAKGPDPGEPVATAFAVLFLRRKFQKHAGPVTPTLVSLAALGPHSKDELVSLCAEQLVARGREALPEVLRALRSDVLPQRRAAAAALAKLAGETFGYEASRDEAGNRDALRRAELWYLRNR